MKLFPGHGDTSYDADTPLRTTFTLLGLSMMKYEFATRVLKRPVFLKDSLSELNSLMDNSMRHLLRLSLSKLPIKCDFM